MDFDIFRLDLNGSIGKVLLSAQYRWFQYMSAIHHAWVGCKFTSKDDGRPGITRVPFGNQPFIGGSMAGNGRMEHRIDINFGYYF